MTINKLLEEGFIKRDLSKLLSLIKTMKVYALPEKIMEYKDVFSHMEEQEFLRIFREQEMRILEKESSFNLIDHEQFQNIYEQNTNCQGLALFILFDKQVKSQASKICKQMEETLSNFNFHCEFIDPPVMVDSKKYISDTLTSILSSMESKGFSSLIVVLIGESASLEYSNGKLSYVLKEPSNKNTVISYEEIHAVMYDSLRRLQTVIPAIVLYSWITVNNQILSHDKYLCTDTLFCYVSNSINSLPQLIQPHPFAQSLYEVLKDLPDDALLLIEFSTMIRDHYFNGFPSSVRVSFNKETTFYTKNTLRYPYLIKNGGLQPEINIGSDRTPSALFFLVSSTALLENKWTGMPELIDKTKKLFQSLNYIIGKDLMLTDKENFYKNLVNNISLGNKTRFVFVLVLVTGSRCNQVDFADGSSVNLDLFSYQLANPFYRVPKVILFSQIVEKVDLNPSQLYDNHEHMFIIHSFESNITNNSLINNFALEIRRNYFFELHAIVRSAIVYSTKSSSIQTVDGFRKNFYINYHGHLGQLLNKESMEFKQYYERVCMEGTESFKYSRLMLVGPEGAGKTSLLRVLTGHTFQENEQTTEFVDKYNLQVQRMSHDWSEIDNLGAYIKKIDDTKQDLAMKIVAQQMLQSTLSSEKKLHKSDTSGEQAVQFTYPIGQTFPTSQSKQTYDSSPMPYISEEQIELTEECYNSAPFEKIKSSLDRIKSLKSQTDFFTAWDFAGQNYLCCFHALFLSPRAVYLLLIDLTIDNLNDEIHMRDRDDRHNRRANTGVPTTYLEVYEFWINGIYSVSKKILSNEYCNTSKIILVFSKADEVKNANEIANNHFETIKSYMYKRNNAFNIVHEEDVFFLLSCKIDSPYWKNVAKLKLTIKRLSDQVAFEEPIPIRWLKLANDILKEKQPIIERSRVKDLAVYSKCSNDVQHFLDFFSDIGFFLYRKDKVVVAIQRLLNLIYHILFPQFVRIQEKIPEEKLVQFDKYANLGELSLNLFEYILDRLKLRDFREPLLDLLQLYGILIRCESKNSISNSFYVPYLLTDSLSELMQPFKRHTLKSKFLIFFSDGFLPASLFFILVSQCLRRNEEKDVPPSILGFNCGIFYVSISILASLNFFNDRTNILVSFLADDKLSFEEDGMNIDIVDYLLFLQLSLVEIQNTLVLSDSLAKIMLVCESCDTLSRLEMGEKLTFSLDTVFSTNFSELTSFIEGNIPSKSSTDLRYCCRMQIYQVHGYLKTMNHPTDKNNQCIHDNTKLSDFIYNNRGIIAKKLNWKLLSRDLYSYGLITVEEYSMIVCHYNRLVNISEELLVKIFHKGPLWASKFYVILQINLKDQGHHKILNFINRNITSCQDLKTSRNRTASEPMDPNRLISMSHIYNMRRKRHGIAFIVNIEFFLDGNKFSRRIGSNHDVSSLIRVFDSLQYDTRVYQNLTRKEYIKTQRIINTSDHSQYDSFFCVIMSHGNEKGEVIFSDDKAISKSNIVAQFSPRYCVGLKSKPKIFIFQACRGIIGTPVEYEHGGENIRTELPTDYIESTTDGQVKTAEYSMHCSEIAEQPMSISTISADIDTFIGDSTINQYVSFRSESKGTFFIQSFCSVMLSCKNMEFTYIMMEVRRKVSLISKYHRQCTEDTNRLTGQVYF